MNLPVPVSNPEYRCCRLRSYPRICSFQAGQTSPRACRKWHVRFRIRGFWFSGLWWQLPNLHWCWQRYYRHSGLTWCQGHNPVPWPWHRWGTLGCRNEGTPFRRRISMLARTCLRTRRLRDKWHQSRRFSIPSTCRGNNLRRSSRPLCLAGCSKYHHLVARCSNSDGYGLLPLLLWKSGCPHSRCRYRLLLHQLLYLTDRCCLYWRWCTKATLHPWQRLFG